MPKKKSALSASRSVGDAMDFRSLPAPIRLYEDECIFCHSFRTTQFHGPMVRLANERIMGTDEDNPNGDYVHLKCLEWTPEVWFEGDTVMDLESAKKRAAGLKCHRCGIRGAALGCYFNGCNKTFHVPCAVQIDDCRWDVDHRCMLCPEHASEVLPCDELSSQTKESHQFSSLPQSCMPDEEGTPNACHSDKWVFFGSSLSASEKESIANFAHCKNATVVNEWVADVTHIIVGRNPGRSWHRSYEVLMAILLGKWVVPFTWVEDCLEMHPGKENSYEITFSDDPLNPLDAPKKGRTRAAEGAPKLFSGLHFFLSTSMSPGDRDRMRNLIAAAGGSVLERGSRCLEMSSARAPGDSSSPKPYFVYIGGTSGEQFSVRSLQMEVEEAREHVGDGACVISDVTVMDAIAAYDVEVLDKKLIPQFKACP